MKLKTLLRYAATVNRPGLEQVLKPISLEKTVYTISELLRGEPKVAGAFPLTTVLDPTLQPTRLKSKAEAFFQRFWAAGCGSGPGGSG